MSRGGGRPGGAPPPAASSSAMKKGMSFELNLQWWQAGGGGGVEFDRSRMEGSICDLAFAAVSTAQARLKKRDSDALCGGYARRRGCRCSRCLQGARAMAAAAAAARSTATTQQSNEHNNNDDDDCSSDNNDNSVLKGFSTRLKLIETRRQQVTKTPHNAHCTSHGLSRSFLVSFRTTNMLKYANFSANPLVAAPPRPFKPLSPP